MFKKGKELMLLLGIMAFSVLMLLETNNIHLGRGRTPVGPAMWPRMVLGVMLACAAILFFINLRRLRRGESLEAEKNEAESVCTDDIAAHKEEYPQRGLYSLLFMVFYVALLPYAGFVLSTLVLLFAYLVSLRLKVGQSALLSLGSTAVITYLFPYVLSVPLPKGVGVFFQLSKFIY